jgi:hypothetical protein
MDYRRWEHLENGFSRCFNRYHVARLVLWRQRVTGTPIG